MRLDRHLCTGCGECIPYCPVSAISLGTTSSRSEIDRESCVECEACLRAGVCPSGALQREELPWPRAVRSFFSNPQTTHRHTQVPGRGTEEMKTNDVTGRIPAGAVGLAVEVGRPLTGATFKDVQEVTAACARYGCVFEPNNPLTALMDDTSRGTFRPDILEERMLSVLVEMTVPQERLPGLLDSLKNVSLRLPTVFSLGLCQTVGSGGEMPMLDILEAQGIAVRPNGKINLGLGRRLPPPPAHEREE